MNKIIKRIGIFLIMGLFISVISLLQVKPAHTDEEDLFTVSIPPNVLFILDNSNSMDVDFIGNCVCSWASGSRSVEGRKALIGIVDAYVNVMRIGIMSYNLPGSSKYYLHSAEYFASYEPKSYCPNPPPECEEYCKTGDTAKKAICEAACIEQNPSFDVDYMDEIIPYFSVGSEQRNRYCNLVYPKCNRYINPTDTSHYVYYKKPGTFYAGSNYGTRFAYSTNYNPIEGNTDNYSGYSQKTGTSDNYNDSDPFADGYSSYQFYWGFSPTDEDWALGVGDFGRRLAWYYTGRTWFANSSPGGGFLHIVCNDNNEANDGHKNALLAKLATNENDETGYMSCSNTSNPNDCSYIVNAGLTPTAGTLQSAMDYFQGTLGNYSSPIQDWCQKNYVVYVTDGLPSVSENGSTGSADALMPAVLTKLDNLRSSISKSFGGTSYDFDVKTYVIGLGLTTEAKAKLDDMAVHGGTAVDGHAYYADNIEQLTSGLYLILQDIVENNYSFAAASVTSSRTSDENYIYEASFLPVNDDPFWLGYLRKYSINTDGTVGSQVWEAGSVLQSTDAGSRTIKTYKSGAFVSFTTSNIAAADLEAATDPERDAIVGYFRGEADYNPDNWKLGDIFRSDPVTIGTPSAYFNDVRDSNDAFADFRSNNQRTSANGKRVIVVGANDGQLHAFKTGTGAETWSFIPPNLLPKLKDVAHSSHPTELSHQYFVDGYISVSDVWLGSGDGTSKSASNWKTLLIFGEGRGGTTRLWSSSSSCDCGFDSTYSADFPYYCGYYCFDVTDALNPVYKWRINPTASQAPYLGDPWCKVSTGRVKINGVEKWVGFIGAGYNAQDCSNINKCNTNGKGLFVIDLNTGDVLWSYTLADNADMIYSIAAPPAIVDTDNDGFIDTAYVGDLGNNMWRFTFCTAADESSCGTSNWSGGMLFQSSVGVIRPIFTSATVAKDSMGNLWVYWGTGDKTDPTAANAQEKFYAVKDNRTSTYGIGNLENITTSTYDNSSTNPGWYINLAGQGEKVLADPVVFGGVVYFTTFIPDQSGDPCAYGGDANLYGVDYVTGGGMLSESGDRDMNVGTGLPSIPVISLKPGSGLPPDLYITTSGGGPGERTQRIDFDPPTLANRTNMLFWKDHRLQ